MKKLGRELRKLREKCAVTQKQMADELGLTSPQFISNIERGKAPLPAHFVPPVSRILAIPEKVLVELLVESYRRGMQAAIRETKGHPQRGNSS